MPLYEHSFLYLIERFNGLIEILLLTPCRPSAVERLSLLHNGAEVLRKSDESAYAIVPSRISSRLPSIYSNPSSLSIESAELVYRRLSVDDDLFTARVYKRNYRHPLMNFLMKTRPSTSLRMREGLPAEIVSTGTLNHPVQRASSEDQSVFSHDREESISQPPHSTCASILEKSDKFDRVIVPDSPWILGLPIHTTGKNTIVGPAVSTDLVYVYKESCTYQIRNLFESVSQCQPDHLAHLLRLLAWGFHSWRKWYLHEACNQKKGDLVQLLIDDDWSLGKSLLKDQGELGGHHLDEGGLRLLRTKMGKDAVTDDVAWAQFQKACREGQHQSVKNLLPYGLPANHDLLLAAVDKGDYDTVDFLLKNGFDVNARFGDGQTCLLKMASWYFESTLVWPDYIHDSRVMDILLEHGADIEATTRNGDNFCHLVARTGYLQTANYLQSLLVHKTRLSFALAAVNQQGETPVVVAEKMGNQRFLIFVDDVNPLIKDTCNASMAKQEVLSLPTCLPKGSHTIGQQGETSAIRAEQVGNERFLPVEIHVDQNVKGTYSAPVSPQVMLSFPASRRSKGSNKIDSFAGDGIRMKSPSRKSI